jgi:hypothetical protein
LKQLNKKMQIDCPVLSLTRFKSSSDASSKKEFSNRTHWRLSKKTKSLLAAAFIVVILISAFAFMPREKEKPAGSTDPQSTEVPFGSPSGTPQDTHPPSSPNVISQFASIVSNAASDIVSSLSSSNSRGTFESAQTMDVNAWRQVASDAWRYFTPGIGVDSTTGLPRAGEGAPYFTDWDLGVYIQAIIDANQTGIISNSGAWGSSARIEKVITFLETRELNETTGYPFWFYQAADGKNYHENSDKSADLLDVMDTGRLLVALNNLKEFNSSLTGRIDTIVKGPGNRSNYSIVLTSLVSDSYTSKSIYAYYMARGYSSFWPQELNGVPERIMSNIFAAEITTTYGVSLPKAEISCEPLLCAFFETKNTSQLMSLTSQVYLAHEAYYNATGKYRAFSEGSAPQGNWAYEWVVRPDGRTWAVLYGDGPDLNIPPMIYIKTSVSFLSIFNTSYAKNMTIYLERNLPEPALGYGEGVDEEGTQLTHLSVHTNGLILEAAKYAINS